MKNYIVHIKNGETGAFSPVDVITAADDYTASDYVRDCLEVSEDYWCEMLKSAAYVTLEDVDEPEGNQEAFYFPDDADGFFGSADTQPLTLEDLKFAYLQGSVMYRTGKTLEQWIDENFHKIYKWFCIREDGNAKKWEYSNGENWGYGTPDSKDSALYLLDQFQNGRIDVIDIAHGESPKCTETIYAYENSN